MKKKKQIEEDMSNTFVFEVGQKSAIFDDNLDGALEENNSEDNAADDFFDEPKKKKKKKEKKQKNKKNSGFLMTILMILCVGIGIGLSYCYFMVYGNSSTKMKKEVISSKSIDEELAPDGVFSTSLIERYDSYNSNDSDIYRALYDKDKIKVDDISEEYIKSITAKRALYLNKDSSDISFSSSDFNRALKELFGDKVSIAEGDITSPRFKYSSKLKKYIYEDSENVENDGYKLIRKIIKSVKKNNCIEINVAVAITFDDKIYKSLDKNSVINDFNLSDFKIDKDYTKLNQYKYIFDYDKNNDNYILDGIELIK